jgi:hypothetical protein
MTLNRYSHVTPSMQREAADALERAIEDAAALDKVGGEEDEQTDAV